MASHSSKALIHHRSPFNRGSQRLALTKPTFIRYSLHLGCTLQLQFLTMRIITEFSGCDSARSGNCDASLIRAMGSQPNALVSLLQRETITNSQLRKRPKTIQHHKQPSCQYSSDRPDSTVAMHLFVHCSQRRHRRRPMEISSRRPLTPATWISARLCRNHSESAEASECVAFELN